MKKYPRIWLVSDCHYKHDWLEEKGYRPANITDVIVKNINAVVRPQDTLINLGDISWDDNLRLPNCRNILVKGNHDSHPYQWYMSKGFDFACEEFSIRYGGYNILFTHQPKIFHEYDLNIHGHLHNFATVTSPCKHSLIALEYTDYKPVLLDKVLHQFRMENIKEWEDMISSVGEKEV